MRYFTDKSHFYMSRRVSEEVDQELIRIMLAMIEDNNRNAIKSDYFKVFKFRNSLENGRRYLVVTETQERPRMKLKKKFIYTDEERSLIELDGPLTIWCISDGVHNDVENVTFLFPDEY